MKAKTLPQKSVWKLLIFIAYMTMLVPTGFAQEVTIFTDKDDYYPGEWVVITGSGWENDESVLINLTHIEPNIPDHTHDPWYLYPDANGDIYDEWFVFDEELGTSFWLTATGTNTGLFAESWFTDGNAVTFNVGVQNGVVYSGIGGNVTYAVDATRDGAGNAFSTTLSAIGLPTGVTANFDPSSISFPRQSPGITKNSVLTLTIPNTVTEGTYTFTINGTNGDESGDITLVVSGCAPPTAYMVTGTGTYCAGDPGLVIGLTSSQTGVDYQLYIGGTTTVGSPVAGTGTAISLGIQPAGTYTVLATRVAGGCTNNMNGSAVVTENTIDPGIIVKGATNPEPGCGSLNPNAAGTIASGSTEASGSGTITYQWEMSLDESSWDEITSATSSSFNIPEISQTTFYRRVATSTLNGVECSAISNELEYIVYPLPEVAAISADGSTDICVGSTVQLSCPTPGGTWSSDDPSIATVNPSTGLVTGISAGTLSTGIHYTVISNDGCSKSANKSISVLPLPEVPTANNVNVTYDGTSHSASATVPSGYEIDWYTTETGSTTTTAPSGTNAGTYTAWAEARNTTTGCVSDGRTEVTLVIEKRPVTITTNAGQTKVYGEADPLPFTYQVTSGSLASGDAFDGVLERVSGEPVGTYAINKGSLTIAEGATNKENNYDVTYESADLTINQLAVAVNAVAKSKTYGDLDPALTFVSVPAAGTTLANGEVISFTGVLSRDLGENVGAYAINQNTIDNSNYDISYTSADLTIGQLAVTVTADAQSKTYGDVDPELTFVASPAVETVLANGEVIAFTGALSRVAGEDVGAYAIQQNDIANANYDISYTSADLTIGQLAVTVTADAKSKTYGDVDPAPTFVSVPAVGTSLANGETISFAGALSRVAGENVGAYAINQNTVDNTNYDITYTSADLTIGQLAVTVTADAQSKTYGDADPALTFVSVPAVGTSLANGETISFAGALSRVAGENVGAYAINQNTVDNTNYDITYTSADLTIGQLAVAVNAVAKSKTYGDLDPALTFVSVPAAGTTLANGEVISFTGVLSRVAGENVGAYAINQNTVDNTNYDITYTSADLTIGQLAVAVNAVAKSKTYGDLDPALTFVSVPAAGTTLANGEVISFAGALDRDLGENVGAYAINQNTVDNTNYDITYTSADLTIGQLAVAVNAVAKSKTYGDLDPALTFVSVPAAGTTLANGEVISFTGVLSRVAGENVGAYAINQNTVDNTNYDITYTSADLTIGQLAVAVNAVAKSKTYGDLDPALTFVSVPAAGTTLANGEVISFTGALDRDLGENVGAYAINQNTVDNTNYDITYTSADLTIGQLAVAVNADAKSKYCGQVDPSLSFISSPIVGTVLINGEVIGFTGDLTRESGEDVGPHTILQGTLDNSNYAITYIGANLIIESVSIDASTSSTPVAIGNPSTLTATVVNENLVPVQGVAVTFIVAYYENSVEQTQFTGSTSTDINGIASISDVSVPEVKVYKVSAIAGEGCSEPSVAYLPVYDPSAGFVTGGGWIMSPAGAYYADETRVGKANFGFNAKYKKGNKEVDGNTEFQFKAGDLNFKSSSHDAMTLVISGAKATYKGKGSINGNSGYAFMVSVIDGDVKAKGEPDLFRIKIWVDGSPSNVIYDNQLGVDENADATTVLGGGSIVIHEVKSSGNKAAYIEPGVAVAESPTLTVYPNPFSDRLRFEFASPETVDARIDLYDMNGRLVKTVFDGTIEGKVTNQADFIPEGHVSGTYLYHCIIGDKTFTGKVIYKQ